MMDVRRLLILGLAGPALAGCATVIEGTTDTIAVNSRPVSGAECEASHKDGLYYVTTPGTITVEKSKDDLTFRCTRAGYEDAVKVVPSTFKATTLGNILLGGVIGVGVDAASGAMNEYPKAVVIELKPLPGTEPPAPEAIPAEEAVGAPGTMAPIPDDEPKPGV
ncbi:MAG: hypothetical protein HXY25_10635 [Alphaproteobacteria bacterium]|nr:hypothetical protein [Alphaproteobacteria bacterium]